MLFSFHIFVKFPDLLLLLLISFHVVIEDTLYVWFLSSKIYLLLWSIWIFPMCTWECIFRCWVHCSLCLLGLSSCSVQVLLPFLPCLIDLSNRESGMLKPPPVLLFPVSFPFKLTWGSSLYKGQEAQRGQVTFPGSHSQSVAQLRSEQGCSIPRPVLFLPQDWISSDCWEKTRFRVDPRIRQRRAFQGARAEGKSPSQSWGPDWILYWEGTLYVSRWRTG